MKSNRVKRIIPWMLLLALTVVIPGTVVFFEQGGFAAGQETALGASGKAAPSKAKESAKPAEGEQKQAQTKSAEAPKGEVSKGEGATPPEDTPVPIRTEALDEAGQALGKKIDEVGRGASRTFGSWVNAKAFLGITWLKLFFCALVLVLVVVANRVVRYVIAAQIRLCQAKGLETGWYALFLEAVSRPLFVFLKVYGIYLAITPLLGYLDGPGTTSLVHRIATKVADLGGTFALIWFVYRFLHVVDVQLRKWAYATQSTIDDMLVPLVGKTLKAFVIVVGGIMVVQNLTGIEIGPLLASLGIGGLAFALAGKDSIANFFGSLTILLDKPFQVGERVVIDSHDGFVEDVGFRSTRLRTLKGSLVSIPNEKIIVSTLENVGRRIHIRWTPTIGITYDTPPAKVARALAIIREVLENHEGMKPEYPPRVHFTGFGDWSLNIGVYAWYHPADFWAYQAWVERISLTIMERFAEERIEFAFPTQTVYQYNMKMDAPPAKQKPGAAGVFPEEESEYV